MNGFVFCKKSLSVRVIPVLRGIVSRAYFLKKRLLDTNLFRFATQIHEKRQISHYKTQNRLLILF